MPLYRFALSRLAHRLVARAQREGHHAKVCYKTWPKGTAEPEDFTIVSWTAPVPGEHQRAWGRSDESNYEPPAPSL